MNESALKHPSALLPIGMSLAACVVVVVHVAVYGAAREADEGAAAHIFQLLVLAQLPLIAYFALRWLPRAPGQALAVLALQACAVIAAFAPVYWFKL